MESDYFYKISNVWPATLSLDFEYYNSTERNLTVVCVSLVFRQVHQDKPREVSYWLLDESDRLKFKDVIARFRKGSGVTLLAFAANAEARALLSLGIDPFQFNWIDLHLEYKMLLNHNHQYAYGKQLIKGRKVFTHPPKNKWEMSEEERTGKSRSKPETNLGACCYKMLGLTIDTDHKNIMRTRIIQGAPYSDQEKQKIVEYCEDDTKHLYDLFYALVEAIFKSANSATTFWKEYKEESALRAEYALETALMEQRGYPVNVKRLRNFASSVNDILMECQRDINSQFPKTPLFKWNWKEQRFSKDLSVLHAYVAKFLHANPGASWLKTDKGQNSLKLEAFEQHFSFGHSYPRGHMFAQYIRFLKLSKSLNGFSATTNSSKKTIFDSLGSDGRVRPYFNIFGSQSARSQPSATSFIPLKAAWMRCLIEPRPGRVVIGVDYSSQEFLIAALLSEDMNMIKAYHSGDPYIATGKLAGALPATATKESHSAERAGFKSTVLGISYLMGPYSLANKLTADTGKKHELKDAINLIDLFYKAYPRLKMWQDRVFKFYRFGKPIKLPCGWYMFKNNTNQRSVKNCPVQGMASSIMRRAVKECRLSGLEVIYTLHDALYIETDYENRFEASEKLMQAMHAGFVYYFGDKVKEYANCRMDVDIWGPDCEKSKGTIAREKGLSEAEFNQYPEYIDPRAVEEYDRFKKYFNFSREVERLLTAFV